MPAALIAQLILQFGIPATRQILELMRSSPTPSLEDWLKTLDAMESNALKFLKQTEPLTLVPLPPS